MKILLSPVGRSDPHGKTGSAGGEQTQASALQIFDIVAPDTVYLLPTRHTNGQGTEKQAEDTGFWMKEKRPETHVEIIPVDMEAANDHEEAIRAFSAVLTRLAQEHLGAELVVNASSGTPAIKLACLLLIAEGRIRATPYYADDPTATRRADPVRPVNVTFLRESGLIQRSRDLLAAGQFALAQEPLSDLEQAAFTAERKLWAGFAKRLADGLRLWDERHYSDARNRLRKLQREWADASPELSILLEQQQETLDKLCAGIPPDGVLAWDLYFIASRLQAQGHLSAALETFWIAIENVLFEYACRKYHVNGNDSQFQMRDAIKRLRDEEQDIPFATLLSTKMDNATVEQRYRSLRGSRNEKVHHGKSTTEGEVNETRDLAQLWIAHLGGPKPVGYPMDLSTIKQMARFIPI